MPIDISCPNCHRRYSLSDNYLGKKVLCKSCETPFVVENDDAIDDYFNDLPTRESKQVPAEPIWDSPEPAWDAFEPEPASQNPYRRAPREYANQPHRSNSNVLIIVLVLVGFGVSAVAAGWYAVTLRAERARQATEEWVRLNQNFDELPGMNEQERQQWDQMDQHFNEMQRMVEEQQAEMEKSFQRQQELMQRMQDAGWQEQQELMDRMRQDSLRRQQEQMERVRKTMEDLHNGNRAAPPNFPRPPEFP